jgi:Zn-dependent protease with chaperone function
VMKLYAVALILSLLLFYMAVPFVSAGVILVTVALMYLALMAPFFRLHLMAVVGVMGFGIAIAVLKSLFAKTSPETFGVRKTEQDCPQLIDTVRSVAEAVETDFVDQVYVAPGSEIGVHQQGRGPFGILGVKRRVLVLGFGSVQVLTIGELKAILAHEYAHFTHRDTLYSRIVHQVTMSIREALRAMGEHLGSLNYVNPFFWFFYLYFKAYSTLSAGFFRTREYMADRMAASLYGRNAFVSALTKVATEAQLFEATAHQNIVAFLREGKAFANVYEAFRAYREQQLPQSEREKLYADMLNEQPSLLASHPAFDQRIAAVRDLPDLETSEPDPAAALFEDVEQIEQELTLYLTQYHYAYEQMAMAASRA